MFNDIRNKQVEHLIPFGCVLSNLTRLSCAVLLHLSSLLPVYLYFLAQYKEVMKMKTSRTIKGYFNGVGYMGWIDEYSDYMLFDTESGYIEYLESLEERCSK